jgi:hypothetical protein
MRHALTDYQHRCVELIIGQIREYLGLRYAQTTRANPRFRECWADLEWQQIQQLRNVIESDKAWGPKRYLVAELLCGDEKNKVRDLFTATNQNTIQSEVVEKHEKITHTTGDVMEIHDFRTLYEAIDPAISTITSVMQVYIWWDLLDAAHCARFQLKLERIKEIESGNIAPYRDYYVDLLRTPESEPSTDDILLYEMTELKYTVDQFVRRREGEPGYQIIIARAGLSTDEGVDRLISTIARQQVLLKSIEDGAPAEDRVKQQIARALNTDSDHLTADQIIKYLKNLIGEEKGKLRAALDVEAEGEPYNFKLAQAEAMKKKYQAVIGDRSIPSSRSSTNSGVAALPT